MQERNLCIESGCQATCCQNKYLYLDSVVTDSFPQAEKVPYYNLNEFHEPGVYFTISQNLFLIRIVGMCPNVNKNFGCKIQKFKPQWCKNYIKDESLCLKERGFTQRKYQIFTGIKSFLIHRV